MHDVAAELIMYFGWILPYVASISIGILTIHLLFPAERVGWKVAGGCATAVAVLACATFFLSAADVPIEAASITTILACASALLLLIAVTARLRQRRPAAIRTRLAADHRWTAVAAGAVSIFALAVPWAMSAPMAEATEFFIVESTDRMPPWRRVIPPDQAITITLGLRVRDAVARDFDIVVRTDGAETQSVPLGTVESPTYLEALLTLPPRDHDPVFYEFLLVSPNSTAPYRTLSFWTVSSTTPSP